jgi:hydrocephalus-inducing protein
MGVELTVVDSQTKQTTATIQYPVVADSYFNAFSVSCGNCINFGEVTSNTLQHRDFTLTNTGVFPFDYEIKSRNPEEPLPAAPQTGKGAKPKKAANPHLAIGPFSISPTSGSLAPSASATISVDLNSPTGGKQSGGLVIAVSDLPPNSQAGRIRLMATVFVPGLQLASLDRLFPRLPLMLRMDLAKSDITSFVEDDFVLHFSPKLTGQKESVNVRLINPMPIELVAELQLKPKQKGEKIPFEVSDKLVTIAPNAFKNIVLTFAPISAETFQAGFEAAVRNGTDPETKALKFNIEGVAVIPAISLRTALDKGKGAAFILNVGKTLVGTDRQRVITFGNDVPVAIQVIAQIKVTADFDVAGVDLTRPFTVEANQQFSLAVYHRPQKPRKGQVDITVAPADNQKTAIAIQCTGDGFSEDLVFEGLEGEDNELHFKGAVAGRSQSVCFSMKSACDQVIRFGWSSSNDITFSPRIGHLHPFQSKEITATFLSEKPTKYLGSKVICQIAKILLDERSEDWDDTQKMVAFVPRKDLDPSAAKPNEVVKVAQSRPEPAYHQAVAGKPRDIAIKLYLISDVLKVSIDCNEIPFSPTMMYQPRSAEFHLTNLSQVRLEYDWFLQRYESLRTDYATTRPPVFTIEPGSGYIEAGQTTTFRAVFSPLDVDDFLAEFVAKIPYLTTESPKIMMTGLSRRPLCHFNVQVSDYLTRRHPDFTYQLPEDVKTIEVFSTDVKVKSVKKVEVINPTATPYEATWTLLQDNAGGTIVSESRASLLSGGKPHIFLFTYTPATPKVVECLYTFEIPVHNIKVVFLFVGRVSR